MQYVVELAQPEDADRLARLHYRSHIESFAPYVSAGWLASRQLANYQSQWHEHFSVSNRRSRVWIVRDSDDAVGMVRVVPGSGPDIAQLNNMHVRPDLIGAGVGRALMQAAMEFIKEQGYRTARLGVVQENRRARRFYEAAGWQVDELLPHGIEGVPIAIYRLGIS